MSNLTANIFIRDEDQIYAVKSDTSIWVNLGLECGVFPYTSEKAREIAKAFEDAAQLMEKLNEPS